MDYNCITRCGFRMVFISAALLFFVVARPASAGVIAFYTDFASWQADASAAGFTIATEDFVAKPPLHPVFSVAGIDCLADARQGSFDNNNHRFGGGAIEKVV